MSYLFKMDKGYGWPASSRTGKWHIAPGDGSQVVSGKERGLCGRPFPGDRGVPVHSEGFVAKPHICKGCFRLAFL